MTDVDNEARRAWFSGNVLPLEGELRSYAKRFQRGADGEADDLVNETFARLISYDGWRELDSPSAFAHRILRNIALDAVRRSKIVSIRAVASFDELGLVDEAPNPEAVAVSRDELRRLMRIVAELPPQARRVFNLKRVYEMSTADIAEQLGLSVSTVEKHLTRALRICSERLGRGEVRQGGTYPGSPWRRLQDRGGET